MRKLGLVSEQSSKVMRSTKVGSTVIEANGLISFVRFVCSAYVFCY